MLVIYHEKPPCGYQHILDNFVTMLESRGKSFGLPLSLHNQPAYVEDKEDSIKAVFQKMKDAGVRIVLCLLSFDENSSSAFFTDCLIKKVSDSIGVPSQCMKWSTMINPSSSSYQSNLLMEMNYKMGGVCHTLATRLSQYSQQILQMKSELQGNQQGKLASFISCPKWIYLLFLYFPLFFVILFLLVSFQYPPKSISWLFDESCMMIGISLKNFVSSSNEKFNLCSVVGSMDGMLGQFGLHLSTYSSADQLSTVLERGFRQLFSCFSFRNERIAPKRIISYYNEEEERTRSENIITSLHNCFVPYSGSSSSDDFSQSSTKIAVVSCQRNHHTRFMYEYHRQLKQKQPENKKKKKSRLYDQHGLDGLTSEAMGDEEKHSIIDQITYLNPCVGFCVDGREEFSRLSSFTSEPTTNDISSVISSHSLEFYLMSHITPDETNIPCKYSLVYDEIGLEVVCIWFFFVLSLSVFALLDH
jgi:hypothetical protein